MHTYLRDKRSVSTVSSDTPNDISVNGRVLTHNGGGSTLWSDALKGTQRCGPASLAPTERRTSAFPCWLSPARPDSTSSTQTGDRYRVCVSLKDCIWFHNKMRQRRLNSPVFTSGSSGKMLSTRRL